MFITPGGAATAPRRTCPSCLSGVSNWVTSCPYCKTPLPPVTPSAPAAPTGSPGAAPWIRPAGARRNSTLKALVVATVVIWIMSVVAVFMLMVRPMIPLIRRGLGPEEVYATIIADPGFLGRLLIVNILLTGVGGYVAGWLGREREIFHAGMLGVITLFFSALGTLPKPHAFSLGYLVAAGAMTLLSPLFGGYLSRLVRERREDADSSLKASLPESPAPQHSAPTVDVKSLWIDRKGRYLYVPIVYRLGCYLVPPERAAAIDRDLLTFRWIALPALVYCAWPGLDPVVRLLHITIAGCLVVIGLLWRSRDLIPVSVARSDIARGTVKWRATLQSR